MIPSTEATVTVGIEVTPPSEVSGDLDSEVIVLLPLSVSDKVVVIGPEVVLAIPSIIIVSIELVQVVSESE